MKLFENLARTISRGACLSLALVCASAVAQTPSFLPWKYNQSWTRPLASHVSIVANCAGQPLTFLPIIAMDDFVCNQNGPIVRISWWGTSEIPNQPARNFFFRIFEKPSPTACVIGPQLYQACVQASVRRVGVDCQNRTVWYYSAKFANPFSQVAGRQYWLQISEVDGLGTSPGSPTPAAVDFRWSAHRDIRNCPAVQRNLVTGTTIQPLLDPCDQLPDDLAFRLYSRSVSGTITNIPTERPGVYRMCFRDPNDLRLLESIEFSTDDQGHFYVAPEIADGRVRVYINGMSGIEQDLGLLELRNNEDHDLGAITQVLGDVDGDDAVKFSDITRILTAFNRSGAVTP